MMDQHFKKWLPIAGRVLQIAVFVLFGLVVGFMVAAQGSDSRVAAADARTLAERADRLDEIKRLQEAHGIALGALTRLAESTARKVEKAADKADTAAQQAETAAGSAKGSAARAKREAPPTSAGVNAAVRDANRRIGAGK